MQKDVPLAKEENKKNISLGGSWTPESVENAEIANVLLFAILIMITTLFQVVHVSRM